MLGFAAFGNIEAQNLYWNPPSGTSWSTTDANWSTTEAGPASQAWPTGSGVSDIAVFQGTGTGISVGESLSAGGMQFNSDGFTIAASSLQTLGLTGTSPGIDVADGSTATLGSNVRIMSDSLKFTKTGEGVLNITYTAPGSAFYFGSASTSGSQVVVQEGTLKISGAALNNTRITISVSAGADLILNTNFVNIGGFSGDGTITNEGAARTVLLRGTNATFSGVIQGDVGFSKLNGSEYQILAGTDSNTFTGNMSISVGGIILAKEDGAIAMSGAAIILGNTGNGSASPYLRLDGENQIANTTDLNFAANSIVTSKFNLNGHSASLADLTVNILGTGGQNIIDYGINDLGQILTFQSLSAPGILNISNFEVGLDELRFIDDPTAQLGNLFINEENVYATDFGTYWGVTVIPEPSALLLMAMGLLFVVGKARKRFFHQGGRLG